MLHKYTLTLKKSKKRIFPKIEFNFPNLQCKKIIIFKTGKTVRKQLKIGLTKFLSFPKLSRSNEYSKTIQTSHRERLDRSALLEHRFQQINVWIYISTHKKFVLQFNLTLRTAKILNRQAAWWWPKKNVMFTIRFNL